MSTFYAMSRHGSCVALSIHVTCQNLIIPANPSHMVKESVGDDVKGDPLKTHHESHKL